MQPYTHYRQIDKEMDRLFSLKQYSQVWELVEYAMTNFPAYLLYAGCNKLILQGTQGDYDGFLDTVEYLHCQGYGCPPYWQLYEPLKTNPRLSKIIEENNRLIAQARPAAEMRYELHLPPEYTPHKRYPLFIVLHGDGLGGNIEYQRWYWEPQPMLDRGMIVVYVQSSQVSCTGHFKWLGDYEVAKKDIRACYEQVTAQYSVDAAQIYLGGYSGGAIMAVELVMADTLPAKGFVALCPELKPPSFTKVNVLQARQRGVKGVFMEGGQSALLPDEQEMMDIFRETGFPCDLYINEGIGHLFPEDFGAKLDRAITSIGMIGG